jgi:hypothetical protein
MKGKPIVWFPHCLLILTLPILIAFSFRLVDKEREVFFQAFSSGDTEKIDNAIAVSRRVDSPRARAYEGALLMKKAHLVKGPGEKLKMFKAGHELFEKEVSADPSNAELRFIRLCVQENAPRIVKYRSEIEEDKSFLIRAFASLPADLRRHILDYAGSSEVLKREDLNQGN